MGRTKNENKYRLKFIVECHCDKYEQRVLDATVAGTPNGYKRIYMLFRSGTISHIIATNRFAKAVSKVGVSANEAANALLNLRLALKEMAV